MKKLTLLTLTLLLTALVQLTAPSVQAEVSIPDDNLAVAIREALGLPTDAVITADAMRNLTRLWAPGKETADLTGLEHAVNLTELNLNGAAVSNVSLLANLTQLTELRLNNTGVWDVSPLANLTQLTRLELNNTGVWDVSPLANLTQLRVLYLSDTDVSDVSPLANLTQLTSLSLSDTDVWDVSPLAALTQLTILSLWGTLVWDVSPLSGLTQLRVLYLIRTAVSDVSPLSGLTQLTSLDLKYTAVSDVSPLSGLTQLTSLDLYGTAVSDVSPLSGLTQLTWLSLWGTSVSDVSPLSGLTQLTSLELYDTGVSDVSPLSGLTQLTSLNLINTAVSDVSPLANLTQLGTLDLRGCPLNADAHQTHIPAIQANSTEVQFDPFKPIHLQRVPWLVSLIYFRPSDRPVRPNVDAEIDALIKKAQRFFADEMERHGFDRKTFQFEADANGNAVVRHVNGKFPYAHYQQNGGWGEEIREQIYISGKNIAVTMIDTFGEGKFPYGACGHGSRFGASIYCWGWSVIAHELGHVFGMLYHDLRSRYLMSSGGGDELSPCFAAYLDVHPAFNPTVVRIGARATVQMLPATLAAPPNTIRLRFTVVTAPAGSLYQARLLTLDKRYGGLIDCKRIDGNPTSSTVEFVTALTPDTEWVQLEIIGIDGAISGGASFPIDVPSLTEAAPQLVADVNSDGSVNIQDLVLVSGQLGKTGKNSADVNGDGVVNIQDLVLVAAAFSEGAAAPSARAVSLSRLTASDVEHWLIEARVSIRSGSGDPELQIGSASRPGGLSYLRGLAVLERLLASLLPKETALLANYPNPFNPETWIPYQLANPAEVTVTIYAANGAVVRKLDLGHQRAGSYDSRGRAAYWDGRNAGGEPVASGVYFYTLSAGDFKATRKMVIRK